MRKQGILLLLLLTAFCSLLPTIAAEEFYYRIDPFASASPLIIIEYQEQPIRITEFKLQYHDIAPGHNNGDLPSLSYDTYLNEGEEPICTDLTGATSNECRGKNFVFSVDGYLADSPQDYVNNPSLDYYTFYANALDLDNNVINFTLYFDIDAQDVEMLFTDPLVEYDASGKYGIADTNPSDYSISFYPPMPMETCYYGFPQLMSDINFNQEDEPLFNQLAGIMTSPVSLTPTTPGVSKTLEDFTITYPQYQEGNVTKLFVICNETNRYHRGWLWIGYDQTPPEPTASFSPPTIFDPLYRTTELTITTNDYTVCEVENNRYPEDNPVYQKTIPEEYQTFTSINDYTQEHIIPLDFNTLTTPGMPCYAESCTYAFTITCQNLAGLRNDPIEEELTIDLDRTLSITSNTANGQQSTTVELSVITNVDAKCQYQDLNSGDWTDLSTKTTLLAGTEHNESITVPGEGQYDITVACTAGALSDTETIPITVDTDRPTTPELTGPEDPICGGSTVLASATSEDTSTGVSRYTYMLLQGNDLLTRGTTTSGDIRATATMTADERYTLRVWASDGAGWDSANATGQFTYRDSTHTDCDVTPPSTDENVELRASGDGYDVTLLCDDTGGSGCENTARTYNTTPGDACTQAADDYTSNQAIGESFAVSDTRRICWYAEDAAGNIAYDSVDVAADLSIQLISPQFGISPTKQFDLVIMTELPATCKEARNAEYGDDAATMYANMGTSTFTASNDGRTHTIPQFDGFATASGTEATWEWLVVCNANGIYDYTTFPLGYDETPPIITVTTDPQPILTPPYQTQATVDVDDVSLCGYIDPAGSYAHFYDEQPVPGQIKFYVDKGDGTSSYEKQLPESGSFNAGEQYHTHNFSCTNLAGLSSWTEYTVRVEPQSNLEMTFDMENSYGENPIPIEVVTILPADCTYDVYNETTSDHITSGTLSRSATGDPYRHTANPNLPEGRLEIQASCTYDDGLYSNTDQDIIFIDTSAPTIPYVEVTPDPTCTLETSPLIAFTASDRSAISYSYTITAPDGTEQTGTVTNSNTVAADTPLQEGNYRISITATDSFGHSSTGTGTFTATPAGGPACDRTDPIGGVEETTVQGGIEAQVTCTDPEPSSGCAESYSYALIEEGEFCEEASYSTRSYDAGPLMVEDEIVRLCWNVTDQAQPANWDAGNRIISASIYIEQTEPEFGISPHKTFPLEFLTQKAATCRQGETLSSYADMTDEQIYNELTARGASTAFDTTGSMQHHINNFDELARAAEEYEDDWTVACLSEGLYNSETFTVGYDTTAPNYNLYADPNPLSEPVQSSSTLTINTQDEDILCTYLQPVNAPYNAPPATYHFYEPTSNYHNRNHYTTDYETRLPEDDALFFMTASYNVYTYQATCTNLAGNDTDQGLDVIVDPVNNLAVTIGTPQQVSTSRVTINATTVLEAACTYTVDGTETQDLSTTDNHYHQDIRNLPEGEHHLVVACDSIYSGQLHGNDQQSITVDSQSPTDTTLITESPTCSLNNPIIIRMSAEDDGTGIDHYEYELSENGALLGTYTSTTEQATLPVTTPLQNGITYTVRARAIDRAGNEGGWSSTESIEVTYSTHPDCDENPPTGWPEIIDNQAGADVHIHCQDAESGCTEQYRYAVIPQGESCEGTRYSTNTYDNPVSVTEDQLLCWQVSDNAGNTNEGEVDITVSMDIFLIEPLFGIGSTQDYQLTIGTSRTATCRIGFVNPLHPQDLADWYGQLTDSFDQTGGVNHVINNFNVISFGASTCQGQEECTAAMVTICSENGRYHYTIMDIGYDTSPPSLATETNPNPVIEPGNLQSTLSVSSNDEVWCRFVETGSGTSYGFDQYPDITNINQYDTEHERFLGYFSPPPTGQTSYDVTYEVTCTNLAGEEVTGTEILTISPRNQITITINTPAILETRSTTIDVTTDLQSSCVYKFDPNHPDRTFSTSDGTTHTQSYTFPEDEIYELIVSCQALSGPYVATQTKTITVDATAPEMIEIATNDYTCSLNTLSATLMSDASVIGLDHYRYSITDAEGEMLVDWQEESASGTAEITEPLSLTSGETYIWQAQAVDNLNRESTIISRSVTAHDETHPSCDFEDPIANHTFTDVYGGVDVTITCADGGSGCTDSFDEAFSPGDNLQTCTDTPDTYSYSTLPLFYDISGTSCYSVYDNAGNGATGSGHFTIINTCSNGIEDPEEDGIDCGGPCPASCDQCTNNQWDLNEEGIDCGGVCSNNCEQVCGDGFVDAGEECDGGAGLLTCEDFGFTSGTLSCSGSCEYDTTACTQIQVECGNGIVEPGESCDSGNGGLTCEDFGFTSGTLSCTGGCEYDTNACEDDEPGVCGDGTVDNGEECDGDAGGFTCEDFTLISGNMGCSVDCSLDTTGCLIDLCGNGQIDPGEDCDGDLIDFTCEDFSLGSGSITCTNSCQLDTTTCEGSTDGYCGDLVIGPGESCDGSVQGLTCEDFSLRSGELTCDACEISTANCFTGYCGDGNIDQGETCDGINWGEVQDCSDVSSDFLSGMPLCGYDCHFDTTTCVQREKPGEGDDYTTCTDDYDCAIGEECIEGFCLPEGTSVNGSIGGTDTDGDGLPDWWEKEYFGCDDCAEPNEDTDGDGAENINEYYADTNPTDEASFPTGGTKKDHTIPLILLIAGLVFILGGAGYLIYDHYFAPKPEPTTLNDMTAEQQKQQRMSAEEAARITREREEAAHKRKELQDQLKAKHSEEKAKKRKDLLSSFKKDLEEDGVALKDDKQTKTPHEQKEPVKGGEKPTKTDAKTKQQEKTATTAPENEEEPSEQKPQSAATTSTSPKKTSESFSKLDELAKGAKGDALSKLNALNTNEKVFTHLSIITGHSKNKLRNSLNNPTAKQLADLFENAGKRDVTPKTISPALHHLIKKGKISHAVAHKAVHHLSTADLLTEKQRDKIIDGLKKLRKEHA